jgi:integrase/recombinase XerD
VRGRRGRFSCVCPTRIFVHLSKLLVKRTKRPCPSGHFSTISSSTSQRTRRHCGPECAKFSRRIAPNKSAHKGSAATIKQHMAAIRMMFSWLTEKGILAINPAREVKTPKFSRTEGKTLAFSTEEVQKVLASIDTSHVVGLRDESGSKKKEARKRKFLSTISWKRFWMNTSKSQSSEKSRTRFDGANLLKRRLRDAGIVGDYSPHSFRATGITNYLENGGTLEVAQRIAGHADSGTTKLYDRRGQKVLLEDMERIRY